MTVEHVAVRPVQTTDDDAWDAGRSSGRLVVAWQHPRTRLIAPVGLLEHEDEQRYRFRYLRRAAELPDFQPFLGLPELERTYESSSLFPIFTQRIMSPKRPDFSRYLQQLHLSEDASPWEQMARSEGRRTGDTVQVFPVPVVGEDGATTCRFLVHGIRHVTGGHLPRLASGERLLLQPDSTNQEYPNALLVCSSAGVPLGYVPDLLLEHVRVVLAQGSSELVVEHVNGVDAPMHLRLLARLEGRVPTGYQPMTGTAWATFAE